jgi:Protein of unknown function (DUF4236)/Short C-terminal domain
MTDTVCVYGKEQILPVVRLNLFRSGVSTSVGVRGSHVTFGRRTALCAALVLASCGVTSPIERADTTKSNFDGAVYKGTKTEIKSATPSAEAYRVFIQGATGFVSMSAVRNDAEQRAAAFCKEKGDRRWDAIEETTANPPYILGNFPRIEIVFQCLTPTMSLNVLDPKYTKLVDLKRLLDTGVITQAEFDREKAKILAEP